ncbi:MAG: hypothetical protein HQ481_12160 [Alphaproteobacteria bacterium]|nr:hypothetical protein [Alphaproteobacteria bacterium]
MADGMVVIKDRVDVDPNKPLPEFDLPHAKAFAAKGRRDEAAELVAYACEPDVPLRFDDLESMQGFSGSALMRLVEWGIGTWTPRRRRLPVVVYEKPAGGRLIKDVAETIEPLNDEQLTRNFLVPVMTTLRDMSARGVPHRAIRPDNLYYADTSKRMIILGDALTCPPGLNNPSFVETLEQAMADPIARGRGGVTDDLYAIGVCLIFLLLGRNPVHAQDRQELIERKIAIGSYSALTAGARIQMNMMELLRGLLSDEVRERWSIREVELWIGGRRLTPKQAKLPPRAARPLTIAGHDHDNVRSAADAMGRNWLVAADVVRSQDFDNWLRRSLTDEVVVENVNKIVGSSAVVANVPEADSPKLVTRASMALDPAAPLRHKGFACHVDGVGPALAMRFDQEDLRQKIADFINGKFVGQWMSLQVRTRSDLTELYSLFDRLPANLNQTGVGYGIERVLYALNDHIHCRSPLVDVYFITRVEELIPAMEMAANRRDRPSSPMDRHIAAFTAARNPDIDERYFRALSGQDDSGVERTLAALNLYARIQAHSKNGPAPNLAGWFSELLKPAVNKFHNLKQRKAVEANVQKAAESGQLLELHTIYGDNRAVQRDQQGYARALQEHQHCGAQVQQLTIELQNREHMASELGEQVAAVASGVTGSLGSTAIIITYML